MTRSLKSIIVEIRKAEKNKKDKNKKRKAVKLNKLIKYSKEIRKTIGEYDAILFFVQPRGLNYTSYEKEFLLFLKKIKTDSEYCPTFTYPEIEKIDIKNINTVISRLGKINERVKKECINNDIRKIIFELLKLTEAKVSFLKELKLKNFKKAFEFSKIIYGDINEKLCDRANKAYKRKINFLKNRPDKSTLEKKLEKTNFNASKIKKYFELALIKAGLKYSRYKVLIDNNISSVKIIDEDPKYNCPVILIPSEIKVNAIRLMQLISHEIGKHATTNYFHKKQGLVAEIGRGWNIYNEGLAKENENRIKKTMLGKFYRDTEIDFSMYYILAIEKIKKGCNFNKVYKYIFNKCYKENLYDCDYYSEKKFNEKKTIKKYCTKNAVDISKKICMRVFRGFDSKKGYYYFPKDKVYFEGEIMIQKLNKMESREKLEKYLYLARVDAKYVPTLINIGAYKYERGLGEVRNIAERLWKDKKFRESILNYKRN